jgi:hypothetical protein
VTVTSGHNRSCLILRRLRAPIGRSGHLRRPLNPYDPAMPDVGNFVFFTLIWAIRRTVPTGKDSAEMELRARLARGEISPTEFQAREDALRGQP